MFLMFKTLFADGLNESKLFGKAILNFPPIASINGSLLIKLVDKAISVLFTFLELNLNKIILHRYSYLRMQN